MSYFEIANSNFINTSSDVQGGAIFWYGPNGTIRNCNFINDTSVEHGGAITCVICDNGTIDNCSIVNCSSAAGSAIYQENKYLIIKNSIILDNRANSTDLTINSSNSNVIITLYGLNNLFNGIYINGTVNATNLTYWGLNGVTNAGDESKLFTSNNFTEAGIGLRIKILDYENNTLIDDVYYTNENGQVILDLSNLSSSKYYLVSASLDNETYYTSISNNGTFDLRKNVSKTEINDIIYGDQVITVVFDDNVTGNATVYINNTRYTGTVINGVSKINIGTKNAGKYVTNVTYSGDNNYLGFDNKEVNFTINKTNPVLNLNVDNITYGNNITININLTGINGDGLNDTVNLTVNGTKYIINVVDGVGNQILILPNIGVYDIVASFDSTDNYNAVSNTSSFTVSKANLTSFDITVMNTTYNSDNTISFNVKGINNEVIDSQIIVTINGKDYTVDVTAGKGILVLKDLIPNTYDVTATFQETTNYNKSTKNTQFTVNKATPTITITTKNITYGNDETVTITLKGVDNTGLNGTVTLNINGTDYTVNIVNGIGSQDIAEPNAGIYDITANYKGNENYTTTTDMATYTVGKANLTAFNITVMNTTYNSDNTISFNVAGINNEAIDGVVIVTVNGNNYIVNIASGKGTLVLKDLIPNTYDVTAVFQETRNYNSSTTNTEFIVSKSAPVIIIIGENITYGNDETVTIILTGVNNTGLNGTVAISLDSFEALNGRLIGSDIINVEIINGKGVYVFKQLNAGIYNISAAYDANENYSSVKNMSSFTVNKADVSVLNVTVNDSVYGGINTVDITAIGINNELLNGTVKVNVNGNEYNLTLNNGKATLDLENLTTGDYTVKVTFGNDNYNNITNETSFTINKSSTNLNISLVNTTFNGKNHTARFNITLDSSNGMLLNETVNVTINNKTYAVNVVNGTGVLDVDGLSAGNYTVESVFNGNDNFDSSNNTVNFTIDYLTPELNVKIVTDGNKAIIYVRLKYNGTGLNGTVTVNFNNKNYTVNVIDGKGNLTLSNLKNGKYGIDVIFDGDNIYSGISTNASFSIDVPDKNGTDNGNSNTETSEDNNLKSLRFNGNSLPKTGNPIMVLLLALMALTVVIKRKE